MARVGASVVEPEVRQNLISPRSRIFNIGGELFDASGDAPRRAGLPCLPPTHKVFDVFFFWELYDYLAKRSMRQDVPLVAVRNMSCKLMIIFGIPEPLDVNFFGSLRKKFCTWKDLRKALVSEGHPSITLTPTERLFVTLDDDQSSRLAQAWFWFILVVTVANLVRMVKPHVVGWMCGMVGLENCTEAFKLFCLLSFSIDYFVRLACAPFVRLELLSPSMEYFDIDDHARRPLSGWGRLATFAKQSSNLVDLIAIAPYWINIIVGQFLPAASFLRIIRLARLFRIAKSARYLDMLQVLALTLGKSMSMVAILFLLIQLVALIAGCLLQEFEENGETETAFQTVLSSWYWIFCRLIGMKDTPYRSGKVTTDGGVAILAITLTLKGVLWIVPIARIKQIFTQEYAAVVKGSSLRQKIIDDLLADSDKDNLVSTHGSTCARLRVALASGDVVEANVPLPIHGTERTEIAEFIVSPAEQKADINIRMLWEPRQEMQDHPEALPYGKLGLSVLSVTGLPGTIAEVMWQVPRDFFRQEEKKSTWSSHGSSMCEFDISWMSGYAEKKISKKEDTEEHVQLEYGEFQAQVLHLLNQQTIALQKQHKKLDLHRKQLAANSSNS